MAVPLPVSQCHPSDCLLATSGIENVIRLWAPGEGGSQQARGQAQNLAELIASNQVRGSGAAGGEGCLLSRFYASQHSVSPPHPAPFHASSVCPETTGVQSACVPSMPQPTLVMGCLPACQDPWGSASASCVISSCCFELSSLQRGSAAHEGSLRSRFTGPGRYVFCCPSATKTRTVNRHRTKTRTKAAK